MSDYDYVFDSVEHPQPQAQPSPFSVNTVIYVALLILMSATAFLVGIMFERRASADSGDDFTTFWQVWDILEHDYYGDLPAPQERRVGAIQGLVQSLNDPYTSFAPPEEAAVRREQLEGHFGGVGIVVGTNEDLQVVAVNVIPGNPAMEAGIQSGDVFLEVDGMSVDGMTTNDVADLVRGEIGTQVTLKMYRPNDDETFEATLTRAIIETPTVFTQNIDGIGYIALAQFNGVATSQMDENLHQLLDEDVRALILDLRGNGGGLLDVSVDIADMFLDKGLILTERTSSGDEEKFESKDGDFAENIPLVVLVDPGTASASEVLAGALQDRGRAILIGQKTYGKGVVQLVYNLSDGSQLRVTSAAWYTPNNQALNKVGLQPDVTVDPTFMTGDYDPYIQAALDYLNEDQTEEESTNE